MNRRLRNSVLILLLGSATQSLGQTTYDGSTGEMPELRTGSCLGVGGNSMAASSPVELTPSRPAAATAREITP